MAFANAVQEQQGLDAGELTSKPFGWTAVCTEWEDNIQEGVFVSLDGNNICEVKDTSTEIVGISAKIITSYVEDAGVYKKTSTDTIEVHNFGYITVKAIAGETPTKKQTIYTPKTGADKGKATITATSNLNTTCKFVKDLGNNVWLVSAQIL